jgi:hypothetical protein
LLFPPHLSGFIQENVGLLLLKLTKRALFPRLSSFTHLAGLTKKLRQETLKVADKPKKAFLLSESSTKRSIPPHEVFYGTQYHPVPPVEI